MLSQQLTHCCRRGEIRCHLPSLQSLDSHKDHLSKSITSSENVLFYWLITTVDFEIEDSDVHEELLTKIMSHSDAMLLPLSQWRSLNKTTRSQCSIQNLYIQLYKEKVPKHN